MVEGLVDLIASDLQQEQTLNFGNIGVHSLLQRHQLEQLRLRIPKLAANDQFVRAYLRTFTFNADASWAHDLAERRRYLESVRTVVMPLPPAFNSYKAIVLYHLLSLNRQEVGMEGEGMLGGGGWGFKGVWVGEKEADLSPAPPC